MNFAGDGLSLDSIKRDAPLRVGWAGPESLGLRDCREWKRIDKLRKRVDIERRRHTSYCVSLRDRTQ